MVIGRKGIIRDVALGIRLRFKSGRDILRGISRYASRNCHWRIHIINVFDHNTVSAVKTAIARKVDGIILNGVVFPEITTLLKDSSIPLVAFGARTPELGRRTRSLVFVRNNDYAIGQVGADYMTSLGAFRSYVYIPTNHPSYASHLRQGGFTDRLRQKGIAVRAFPIDPSRLDGGYEEIKSLAEWLRTLPKPIAAMAAFDQRAAHLLEAAQLCGLKVPGHLAVLGVDNDATLCENATPPLASIDPGTSRSGLFAAQMLDRLMFCPARKGEPHLARLYPPLRVVVRESARRLACDRSKVSVALEMIRRRACEGVRVADVVAEMGVSRRAAEKHFRLATGKSILQEIDDVRFERGFEMLRDSKRQIGSIAGACGFSTEVALRKAFRLRTGMSMSAWRKRKTSH